MTDFLKSLAEGLAGTLTPEAQGFLASREQVLQQLQNIANLLAQQRVNQAMLQMQAAQLAEQEAMRRMTLEEQTRNQALTRLTTAQTGLNNRLANVRQMVNNIQREVISRGIPDEEKIKEIEKNVDMAVEQAATPYNAIVDTVAPLLKLPEEQKQYLKADPKKIAELLKDELQIPVLTKLAIQQKELQEVHNQIAPQLFSFIDRIRSIWNTAGAGLDKKTINSLAKDYNDIKQTIKNMEQQYADKPHILNYLKLAEHTLDMDTDLLQVFEKPTEITNYRKKLLQYRSEQVAQGWTRLNLMLQSLELKKRALQDLSNYRDIRTLQGWLSLIPQFRYLPHPSDQALADIIEGYATPELRALLESYSQRSVPQEGGGVPPQGAPFRSWGNTSATEPPSDTIWATE
jgi:hypothetical protein